jgi:Uma2 family endonuclease
MIGTVKRYRFTVDQYHRMGKAGILGPDCRVELVSGEIFEMSPIDPWHAGIVTWLTHRFITRLGGRAIVPVQNPTTVDRYSEPQPDLMLVSPREDFYRTAYPTPQDALLVVEVANTSLGHDRRRKLPLYARTGVVEVWIVNRRADAVDVFRDPSPDGYRDQFRRGRGEQVAPSAFPDLQLSVDELLGPPSPPALERQR